MPELLQQWESPPEAWPEVELHPEADVGAVWSRLEARMAWRFSPRSVIWAVSEPGTWRAPLAPVTAATFEVWTNEGWQPVTLEEGPTGPILGPRHYRITATVGAGPVPDAVGEAARRLAAYFVAGRGSAQGATMTAIKFDPAARPEGFLGFHDGTGPSEITVQRASAWRAKALDWSGAGDLLRPYRRAW